MSSAAFVRRRLTTLRAALDANGAVTSATLRGAIERAHAGAGLAPNARAVVVVREPARGAAIDRLAALALARFAVELPLDLLAFYAACDGLWLATETDASGAQLAAGTHYEHGVRPIEAITADIEAGLRTETAPDGTRAVLYPPMIPFFDVPDQGCHAIDLSEAGRSPVIVYWNDEGDPLLTAGRPRIADGLGEWLDGWLTSGLDPFWQDHGSSGVPSSTRRGR